MAVSGIILIFFFSSKYAKLCVVSIKELTVGFRSFYPSGVLKWENHWQQANPCLLLVHAATLLFSPAVLGQEMGLWVLTAASWDRETRGLLLIRTFRTKNIRAQSQPRLVPILRSTSAKQERAGKSCCTRQGWKQAGKKETPTDITTRKLKSPKTGPILLHAFSLISVVCM